MKKQKENGIPEKLEADTHEQKKKKHEKNIKEKKMVGSLNTKGKYTRQPKLK